MFVGQDASLNSRLFISGDVSANSRMFVGQDVSLNSRLFVFGDVSVNSHVFVGQDVSLNSRLFVSNDISANSRLFVAQDSTFSGNVYVSGQVYVTGNNITTSLMTKDVRLDILYKKYLGLTDTQPNNQTPTAETGMYRPAVIPSLQMYSQAIPSVAPVDFIIDSTFSPANGIPSSNSTSRYTSILYPHIAQYNYLKLLDATGSGLGTSFVYSTTRTLNLLINALPSNYDTATNSYVISVYDNNGNLISSNDSTNPWVFDTDSGVLIFTNYAYNPSYRLSFVPSISFYRYEGNYGTVASIIQPNNCIFQF